MNASESTPAGITIRGAVARAVTYGRTDLADMPGTVAMEQVAPDKAGRAVRLGALLRAAEPKPEATHMTAISADGSYRASIPLRDAERSGWVAFELGSQELPPEHGGPFRLTVAEGRTLCWNVKDLATLTVTVGPEPDSVPERPPH